jgi:hypothetical protein
VSGRRGRGAFSTKGPRHDGSHRGGDLSRESIGRHLDFGRKPIEPMPGTTRSLAVSSCRKHTHFVKSISRTPIPLRQPDGLGAIHSAVSRRLRGRSGPAPDGTIYQSSFLLRPHVGRWRRHAAVGIGGQRLNGRDQTARTARTAPARTFRRPDPPAIRAVLEDRTQKSLASICTDSR